MEGGGWVGENPRVLQTILNAFYSLNIQIFRKEEESGRNSSFVRNKLVIAQDNPKLSECV
jgi:hypothetical protein